MLLGNPLWAFKYENVTDSDCVLPVGVSKVCVIHVQIDFRFVPDR